jgi:hypothetical protein
MRSPSAVLVVALFLLPPQARAAPEADNRFPFFAYLTGRGGPTMVTYTPSQLDPRQDVNQRRLATSSIRADLEALRPAFDGLVLYGYHEACTPRIVAVAKELTFKRYEPDDLTIAAARLRGKLPKTVPLSTSEPLAGYQLDAVREFGDFVTPNIHPVFDRPQLGPAEAAAWAREQAAALARRVKKPVVLKETGFPHGGKEMYTPEAQKALWTAYLEPGVLARPADAGQGWVFHGVGFEAFDLPWKSEESRLEVEKSWGLLSAKREPYPALAVWRAVHERVEGKRDGGEK